MSRLLIGPSVVKLTARFGAAHASNQEAERWEHDANKRKQLAMQRNKTPPALHPATTLMAPDVTAERACLARSTRGRRRPHRR